MRSLDAIFFICFAIWRQAKVFEFEMEANGVSAYELDRLERIKENQKMLEELFPQGTDHLTVSKNASSRKRRSRNSLGAGLGSECASEESYNSDEEALPKVKQHKR